MKVFGITGWKNSGKTTLVERLVADITARGFSVSTIKHAHHAFDIDQPGKDSHRHRLAGAAQVLVGSHRRWALMTETRDGPEPALGDLLARLDPVDLVLVEGYKRDAHAKIEARRAATAQNLIAGGDATIVAVAADAPLPGLGVPVFDLDDVAGVADFILDRVGLARTRPGTRHFDTIVMVDWSARATPSPSARSADAIWAGTVRDGIFEAAQYFRTRARLLEWLSGFLVMEHAARRRVLVGFDFPFGYPLGFARTLTGRDEALAVWEHLTEIIQDCETNANNRFDVAARINAASPGVGPFWGRPGGLALPALPTKGKARTGPPPPERRLVEQRIPGAKTCWQLNGAGSVGGQVLTGLPALFRLRADPGLAGAVAVWPFDTGLTMPDAPIVLAEIYPSVLNAAVQQALTPGAIKDEVQVDVTARAFAALDAAGRLAPLFSPDVPAADRAIVAREEGWILGAGFETELRAVAAAACAS